MKFDINSYTSLKGQPTILRYSTFFVPNLVGKTIERKFLKK